jgi:hypothetical protein
MNNLDWINSATRATIPAIVILSFALFKRFFPSKTQAKRIDWNSDELYERFKRTKWYATVGLIFVMIAFALSTWFILSHTNLFLAQIDQPGAIHLLPQTAIWWFFPGFGALACSWEITLRILGLFIGSEDIDLFSNWMDNSTRGWIKSRYSGIDSRKVLRMMAIWIAMPIGVFVLLALPMHATIGHETIRDCGYALKPCKVYPLSDAIRVTEIAGFRDKSGKLIDRAGLVLDFKDGRRWSSAEWGDWSKNVDPKLEEFVLSKTHLPLSYAMTESEIQLPAQ